VTNGDDAADDVTLMAQIAAGSSAALAELFDRYGSLVFTLCERILRDRHHAEDTLLEVYWELWEKASNYRADRSSPRTYLLMLARCRAIDRRRKVANSMLASNSANDGLSPATSIESEWPEQSAISREHRKLVIEALACLNEPQSESVQLSFFDGLTHREISEQLGVPLGTVKTRIRTGLRRLRDKLRAFLPDVEIL